MIKSFAFVVNPTNLDEAKGFWPAFKRMPGFFAKMFSKGSYPCKVIHLKRIQSTQGKEIQGHVIISPLLDNEAPNLDEEFVLNTIYSAGNIAKQLKASLLGLSGYAGYLAEKNHQKIEEKVPLPVTNGKYYSAWAIYETIYRTCRERGLKTNNLTLVIIGADCSIGKLCSERFSSCINKIILQGDDPKILQRIEETILHNNNTMICVEPDINKAIKEADIIINLDFSKVNLEKMVSELEKKPIFCDATLNSKSENNICKGLPVISGTLVKVPFPEDINIDLGLPKGVINASMAETMLLTFEEKSFHHYLGESSCSDKMEEISDIAVQHGFEVWAPHAPVR
ncbi:MAG: hypothetical protein PHO70_02820 [Candidatus Omnitrophica bacterium]|nr:hypothetical protein [Candidatus Omnitrophota bacterium]